MEELVMGIDPGVNGGVALLRAGGKVEKVGAMPGTAGDILALVREWCDSVRVCYIERVHGMPGQGGGAMFTFGENYGHICMALMSCGIKVVDVTPQKWEREYQLGSRRLVGGKAEWKRVLKSKAQQLFPRERVTLKTCDALLIAEYGRRKEYTFNINKDEYDDKD